ncbi:MAG: YhfC family glutamic-type intramembrane protease [Candidatus Eremiobacterota bacterium]
MTALTLLQSLLMTGAPFLLGAWLARRMRLRWQPFLLGMLCFGASQVVHLPLVALFQHFVTARSAGLYALGLGLLAGLCEEPARYLFMRLWLRPRDTGPAILFGAGHGGLECALLGLAVFAALVRSLAEPAPAVGWMPLVSLAERAMAMLFHIAMSVLVLRALTGWGLAALAAAVALHAALDAGAVYATLRGVPVLQVEGLVACFAVVSGVFLAAQRPRPAVAPPCVELPPETSVVVRGLGRSFGERVAVEDLSFEARRGEIFGLLGPNGAGKTTALRMLCGLIPPTRGEAWVNGYHVGSQNEQIRRSIGLLPETPGLFPRLTARENLEVYARLYAVENVEEPMEHYLRLLSLWERRDDRVERFSKGMAHKLAIARCLLHGPRVVFLDEPTSTLDPESACVVREFILELKQRGCTVFLTTHNLDEADRLCDRVAVLRQRLLGLDTPQALRRTLFGTRVGVRVVATTPEVGRELGRLEWVRQVEVEADRYVLDVDDPERNNPALVRRLLELGVEVTYVEELRPGLEDVYFRLIREDR